MKPAAFEYHAPESVSDVTVVARRTRRRRQGARRRAEPRADAGAAPHPLPAHRRPQPGRRAARASSAQNGTLAIRAMTRRRVVEHDATVADAVPLLAKALPLIGHFQIRNRGTVGGSIAHADPASELPAVALALDAELEAAAHGVVAHASRPPSSSSARGPRRRARRDAHRGPLPGVGGPQRLRGRGDRTPQRRLRAHRRRSARSRSNDAGAVSRSAIGLLGMGPTPCARAEAEAGARRHRSPTRPISSEIGRLAAADTDPTADVHASAEYRKHVGAHLVARALDRALGERGVAEHAIQFTVNGSRTRARPRRARRSPTSCARTAALTGTHLGCEHGVCGACTILVDGDAVRSCLMFAVQADGADITTIEGIGPADGSLGPVQEAFRQAHGLQCGFCTPGFVVSVHAFLQDNPNPTPRRDPGRAVGQPLPLHRLPGDHQGGADRRGVAERQGVKEPEHVDADDRVVHGRRPDGRLRGLPRRRAPRARSS